MQASWHRSQWPSLPFAPTSSRRNVATPTMREETEPGKADSHMQRPKPGWVTAESLPPASLPTQAGEKSQRPGTQTQPWNPEASVPEAKALPLDKPPAEGRGHRRAANNEPRPLISPHRLSPDKFQKSSPSGASVRVRGPPSRHPSTPDCPSGFFGMVSFTRL